jgi:hypothetical protein
MAAKAFGVVFFPNARYRGRVLVRYPRAISESAVKEMLGRAGFTGITLYEANALPADWPSDQREAVDKQWTAFLEGTYDGLARPEPPASTSQYQVLGFWYYSGGPHKIVGADGKASSDGKPTPASPWDGGKSSSQNETPATAPASMDPFILNGLGLAAVGVLFMLAGAKKKTREP